MDKEKRFYSVSEASAVLGVSPITIYRLISKSKLTHRRIGKRILIEDQTLSEFGKVEGGQN